MLLRHIVAREHDPIWVPLVADPKQQTTDLINKGLAGFAASFWQRFVADRDTSEGQYLVHHPKAEPSSLRRPVTTVMGRPSARKLRLRPADNQG